jgi:hypothetical protein
MLCAIVARLAPLPFLPFFDGEGDNPHPRYRRGRVWNCLRFLAASIVRANSLGTHQSERNPLSFRAPPPSSLPRFAKQ